MIWWARPPSEARIHIDMYKVLWPISDSYITNRVIDGVRRYDANVGAAGSLDLYKLYGYTSTRSGSLTFPNTELTRLLVKFDLGSLRKSVSIGEVDVNSPTFRCKLMLFDVDGGQPTPKNFTVNVCPLSSSFEEGLGRDVVLYTDSDVCNWHTSSFANGAWLSSGCSAAGDDTGPCDYMTGASGVSTVFSQFFSSGEEDLCIDVTSAVSGVLAGTIPDCGFRISLSAAHEVDNHSYFVKRFASRTAFNELMRPRLAFGFDDSLQDDVNDMRLGDVGYLFLRNYRHDAPANLVSGSQEITGSGCLVLRLDTPVSGGLLSLSFTGSQHFVGTNPRTGVYSASVTIPSDVPALQEQIRVSGSIIFTPVWESLDGTMAYHTGSVVVVRNADSGDENRASRHLNVSVIGLGDCLWTNERRTARIDIFDVSSPQLRRGSRLPVTRPSAVFRDVHWQLRDLMTGRVIVPFDLENNSTRASNDASGMYFEFDASNTIKGRSYVIDVMVVTGNDRQVYSAASSPFKVVDTA